MNLIQYMQIQAGGKGSGCTGPNCGRPKGVVELLEQHGWRQKKDSDIFSYRSAAEPFSALQRQIRVGPNETVASVTSFLKSDTPIVPLADSRQVPPQFENEITGNPTDETTLGENFTPKEDDVIGDYKSTDAFDINQYLFHGMDTRAKDFPIAQTKQRIAALDKIFAKSVTKRDLVVWRGVQGDYAEATKEALLGGIKQLAAPNYQSTSMNKWFAHNYADTSLVLQIHVPKGTRALAMDNMPVDQAWNDTGGGGGWERELLLDRGAVLQVNSTFKNHGILYADVDYVASKKKSV